MRIFVAGATGVVGRRLIPLLVSAGHEVVGTTRHASRASSITSQGARPAIVDVLDADAVRSAVLDAAPDTVIHQLTDLSDEDFQANSRLRVDGTRNLVDAALAAGATRMIAQSIAWLYVPGTEPAVETDPLDPGIRGYPGVAALEATAAEMPTAVILRYGLLYGPGTWYAPDGLISQRLRSGTYDAPHAWGNFVHVDDAASAAVAALSWPSGVVNIVDDRPTPDWRPAFGGTTPSGTPAGRPVSNAKARSLGWKPAHPSIGRP